MARAIGLDRILKRYAKIPPKVKQRMNDALRKSSEQLAEQMYRLVPVDQGDLRGSIDYYARAHFDGLKWVVVAGDDVAFYARLIEFGTPRNRAVPFFYPSYRALRKGIKSSLGRAMRKGIRETRA